MRRYYAENRETVLEKAAERRGSAPPASGVCSECGEEITDGRRDRLVCSRRCKDARYRRLHPEEYAAKQHRKYQRRKARKTA